MTLRFAKQKKHGTGQTYKRAGNLSIVPNIDLPKLEVGKPAFGQRAKLSDSKTQTQLARIKACLTNAKIHKFIVIKRRHG